MEARAATTAMALTFRGTARSRESSGACCWPRSSAGCSTPWISCSTPWPSASCACYFGFGDDTAGMLGTVTLVMSGVGGDDLRLRRRPLRPHAGADGHDPDLLARVARRRDVAERDAAAVLARGARHRHGRRVGIRRGAGQRDVAGAPSQQGDQHHAVGLGARLHDGVDLGGASSSARRRSAPTPGAGSSSSASSPAFFTLWIRRYVREPESWTAEAAEDATDQVRSRSSSARR